MSDNVIKPDDYINLEMTKLFKALLEEYINKEIGEEILLEDYNKLSEEEKASGNYFIKDAGPVNEFTQIFDAISQIESNEEQYRYVGALAIKELLANIILKTDVIDNFLSTATNLPASANSVRILNDELLYKDLIKYIETTTDDIQINIAYVENGQIIIQGSLPPKSSGEYIAKINNTKYTPRIQIIGSTTVTTSVDNGKVNSVYVTSEGYIKIWLNSATTNNVIFSITYPAKKG